MKICSLILLLSVCLIDGKIMPGKDLNVMEKEGFLVYLIADDKFGNVEKCSLTIPSGEVYDIDMKSQNSAKQTTKNGDVIERFSRKNCGVRVKNVSIKSKGIWKLKADDDSKYEIADQIKIEVLPRNIPPEVKNEKVLDGQSYRVNCPSSDGNLYCQIFDKEGELLKNGKFNENCNFGPIDFYTEENNQFTCRTMKWGRMDEIETKINYFKTSKKHETTSYTRKTENSLVLTCEDIESASQCRAESPSKKQYLIMDGQLTAYYSAYDTNLTAGKCSFEIMEPIREEDTGVWRIYMGDKINSVPSFHLPKGCVFEVGQKNIEVRKKRSLTETENVIIYPKINNYQFVVEVPYHLQYCYLLMPETSNSTYTLKDFERTKFMGKCVIYVKNIQSGIYACGVNGEDESEDYHKKFNVQIYDKPVYIHSKVDTSLIHQDVIHLMWTTILNLPIEFCRVKFPNGKVYAVSDEMKESVNQRFAYSGNGLINGECGIVIKEAVNEDFGKYECTLALNTFRKDEFSMTIQTEKPGISLAGIFGATFGVVVLVLFLGLYGGYQFNRHRNNYRNIRQSNDENNPSVSSINMSRNLND